MKEIPLYKLEKYSTDILSRMYKCRSFNNLLSEETRVNIIEILADRYFGKFI